jgi:hypothetical protein
MQGYAFLDSDFNLQYRSKEYIDNDNPYFWQQNKHFIVYRWKFDTDDVKSMMLMFKQIRDIFQQSKLSPETVREFCNMIGFDTKLLKDANTL